MTPRLDFYAVVDDLFDTLVGSARSADQVLTIDAPRLFRAGFGYRSLTAELKLSVEPLSSSFIP
jgi:hypothetical protein